ncbi:mechanosensitive ion channel family protein [Fluviicola chungangensis]|uniref:Mechanosensitive ion channel n=1 Tax=Fluviicola chungangensis TaxID=2597671 RepID=A0A556MMY5_9FLAO|nr:mechanosensitive ion channel domain-containing protein [Fluviicola chungangensis]TSJ41245.1 mechanosensitive ion channel [Fluviicola chungangensis]
MALLDIEADFQRIFGFSLTEGKQWLVKSGTNLIFAAIILFVGFWLAKWIGRLVVKILTKGKVDAGLVTFLSSLTTIILKILVVVTAITQLGIEMTSFVAILGAAGLAIGMAFSGTLSNFAGGVMILLFKPFKVGDFVETQGQQGVVKEIHIFYTYLHTADNKVIVIPNGPVANGNIINFTKADKRRIEWIVGISYGDNYMVAHDAILKFIKEDKRILRDPEPFIGLGSLMDSSINITIRAWVKTDDYWPVYFDMNKRIYESFPEMGLTFPFPQMDVHITKSETV